MKLVPFLVLTAGLLVAGCDSDGANGPPRSARIIKVTVNDAPIFDVNGDGWDGNGIAGGGPEIYFRLFDDEIDYRTDPGADRLNPRDDDEVFALGSEQPWFEDVDLALLPLSWDVDPGYVVRNLEDDLYLALFDYDPFDSDDPMAETDVFRLNTLAPARATGDLDVVTLTGVDLDGNDTDLSVRLTVIFDD